MVTERTIGAMRPIPYSLQFRGHAEEIAPHVLRARATAPGTSFVTAVDDGGIAGRFEPNGDGHEALLELRLVLAGDGTLDATGTIRAGYGNVLRFRTLGSGQLTRSPDPNLRQGTLVLDVDGGEGQFAGARGRIASNFVLSDTGEVTDNHLGVIFVDSRGDGAWRSLSQP